jgi:hypothetical protein
VLGGPNAGQPAFDRLGNRLIFTVESPLIGATEGNGVRILKWPVDSLARGPNSGNDYAIFRYSHILLAKAEAQFMLGNILDALNLVNQVRKRAFNPDKPITITNITLDDILAERGFELLWEGFRRQDLIRTGHFSDAWTLKPASPEYRKIFPIPQIQLDANPNLKQNDGYNTVGIDEIPDLPTKFSLEQNYPNPFNPTTVISYQLSAVSDVELTIYNHLGQEVRTLVKGRKTAGTFQIEWDGRDHAERPLASAVYLYRLKVGSFVQTRKMILLR